MSCRRNGWWIVLIGLVFLSGCQSQPSRPAVVDEPGLFQRGLVYLDDRQQLIFRPCFSSNLQHLEDRTGRLQSRLASQIAPTVYTEITVRPLAESGFWQVNRVHMLGGGEATCRYPLSGNLYRAAGGSRWVADVREDGVYVQDYQNVTSLIFPPSDKTDAGHLQWQGELRSKSGKLIRMYLTLEPKLCRDEYGGEYEFFASLKLDDRRFEGCARQGNLDLRTLPGRYLAELKVDNTPGRRVEMQLRQSGRVLLTQDYQDQQAQMIQWGNWSLLSSGKILVQLEETNGRTDNEILIFARNPSGVLQLEGFNSSYGEGLLRLERIGPDPEQLQALSEVK